MADTMDTVQQLAMDHVADALARRASAPRMAGRTTCANLVCGEPIRPERTALGAQLCMACQQLDEPQVAQVRR